MAQVDSGPATGNSELIFLPNSGIELHIPSGINSLAPVDAPYVDVNVAYSGTVLKTTVAGVRFAIPA